LTSVRNFTLLSEADAKTKPITGVVL